MSRARGGTKRRSTRGVRRITPALLRTMPLPSLDANEDKNARGQALLIGGSTTVPGAILLAGVGALRAGAGKLQLATVRDAAIPLAIALPEALVLGLQPGRDGGIAAKAALANVSLLAGAADAVLVGPGLSDAPGLPALVGGLARQLSAGATLIVDAGALTALRDHDEMLIPLGGRAVLTPHAGEMASLLGLDKREVNADPRGVALHAAARYGAVVALKGANSWIATPEGDTLLFDGGIVGLATSGSGDTLAGVVTGLAARGASPVGAAAWGVWAHGNAGKRLARKIARVGFLASELLAEIPALVGRG